MSTTLGLVRGGAGHSSRRTDRLLALAGRILGAWLCVAAAVAPAAAGAAIIVGDHLASASPSEPVAQNFRICPASPALDINYFTLKTDGGTDTVTKLTLDFTSVDYNSVSAVAIYGDDGTFYGSGAVTARTKTLQLSTPIPVDTTEQQYRVRITPAGYLSTTSIKRPWAWVTGLTAINTCTAGCLVGGDTTHNQLYIDLSAAGKPDPFAATAAAGAVHLDWTNNNASNFSHVVILRSQPSGSVQTSALTNGATYTAGQSINGDSIVYVGPGAGRNKASSFTDYPNPGSTYSYRAFSAQTCGVYGPYHANATSGVVPVPHTIVGDNLGSEPTPVAQACPSSALRDLDHFTLATTARTDTVTSVTLSLANPAAVQRVSITSDDGLVEYGALDNPGANAVVPLTTPIAVTTTAKQYRVRVRPAGYGLAAGSYVVTGTVADIARTSANPVDYGDGTSGAVTVDRSAAAVTSLGGRAVPGAALLAWTNPPPPDFTKVVVLRGPPGGEVQHATLADGTVYMPGTAYGNDTVAYVGPVNSFADDTPGTHRYRVFATDACLNHAAGLGAGPFTVTPAQSGSTGGRWGHLSYDAGVQAVQGKTYDGNENAFEAEAVAGSDLAGTGLSLYVDRTAPTRNEHLVGAVRKHLASNCGTWAPCHGQTLHVQRWNGSSWSDEWSVYFGNKVYGGYYNYAWVYGPLSGRRYDIAYLDSGTAVVAYAKGDDLGPKVGYRIWDGLSWSAEEVVTAPGLTGDIAMVKLTARPGTDELALTVADTSKLSGAGGDYAAGKITTLFWDGMGWGNAPAAPHGTALYSNHVPGDSESFDAAYESVTGNFVVFYGQNPARPSGSSSPIHAAYRYYDQATRSWQSPVQVTGTGFAPCNHAVDTGLQIAAAADPMSNRILVGQSCNRQVGAVIWDGSAIVRQQQLSSYFAYTPPRAKQLAVGWVSRPGSSAAVVMWESWDSGGITYSCSVDGSAFSPAYAFDFAGTAPAKKMWIEAAADPDARDTLMVTFSDANRNLWAKRVTWNGSQSFTWYDSDLGTPLNASPAVDFRGFSFAYDLAPLTTTIADGTNPPDRPAASPLCPAPLGGPTALDAFTLRFSAHTNTVSAVTVALAPGASSYLAKVEITDAAGAALGAVEYPTGDTVTIPLATPLRVTDAAAQYGIRVTPRTRPAMPPGTTFSLTGVVTGLEGLYANQTPSDATSATLVIDNQAPAAPSWGVTLDGRVQGRVVRQDGQLTLQWTPTATGVLLLRSTAPITEVPTDGQLYAAPGTLGASTIVYAGAGTSFADAGVTSGASYHYKLFSVDACGGYSPGVELGPVAPSPPLLAVTSGTLSATLATCSQATLAATFAGDTDDDSVTRFERGASPAGPWSAVAGCASVGGLGPRRCTDAGLAPGSYHYRATFTDPDGAPPPIVAGPLVATECTGLLLASADPQPPGASMPAGSAGWTVGRLRLTSGGAIRLQSISVANTGTAIAGRDLLSLSLVDEATGELLGNGAFDGAYYTFRDLELDVTGSRTMKVVLAVANGATLGTTFQLSLAPAQVVPRAPAVTTGDVVTGSVFTIGLGPTAGSVAPGAPTVQIVNPMDGKLVTGSFKVQVRVYEPLGLDQLASVALTRDGWATSVPLTLNPRYALPANAGMYEAVLPAGPGSFTLVARATNAAGRSALSTQVTVVQARSGTGGDGNLLVRDNSSELCSDCHALESHSSESTRSQYGSWSTTCRDCHTPHDTSNAYLLRETITPPPVNGYQAKRTVRFRGKTGDAADGNASHVNADRTGPCQVCHTRTQDRATGKPRWRGSANLDNHFTAAVGTQSCTSCHLHSAGFSADNPGRNDCVLCHNALLDEMQRTTGHHHLMSSSWTGTSAGSGTTVYPTSAPGASPDDPNRRCLMCHVDHDLFLPDLNPAAGRGMNLRTDISVAPAAPNLGMTNTDFLATTGGICLSCHQASRAKAYPDPKGSVATLAVDRSGFAASAHNYAASAPYKGTGVAEFQANCSKCHTDRLAKRYQTDDVNRFGLHGADWMDSSAVCLSCHRTTSDALAAWPDKAIDGTDLYGSQPMTAPSAGIFRTLTAQWWPDDFPPGYEWKYYTPPLAYRTKHEVGANAAAHKPHTEGQAANDGTLSGANRHVECADCHDPHRAQVTSGLRGTVKAFAQGLQPESLTKVSSTNGVLMVPYMDTLTDSAASWPVPNGLLGWTIKILSGPGAGTTSTIFGNTATTLTVKFAFPSGKTGAPSAPAAGSAYTIVSNGALNATESGGALQGAWGVEPAAWPAQPPPPDWYDGWGTDGQPFQNGDYTFRGLPVYSDVTLVRTATPTRSAAVCLKCHSSYAYGSNPPWSNNGVGGITHWAETDKTFSSVQYNDFTIAGGPGAKKTGSGCTSLLGTGSPKSPLIQASPMGCVMESDVANEFNPNNLAHHAVFAPGKNQPMVASDTAPSVYNPKWPQFRSSPAGASPTAVWVTTTGTNRTVTLHGTNVTWPLTTLPGWFLYLGSDAPAQGVAGWYQVTAVQSPTELTVDRAPPTRTGNTAFMLTPGLAATFVPPWGPWSTLECTDCHASDDVGAPAGATDPLGPHGSGQKWLLRALEPRVYPNYAAPGPIGSSPSSAQDAKSFQIVSNTPVDIGEVVPGKHDPVKTNFCLNCHRFEVYGDFGGFPGPIPNAASEHSRLRHPPASGLHYGVPSALSFTSCTNCHGGARNGAIHGSNLGKGHTGDYRGGDLAAPHYSGKRLLNGASLVGIKRPSKASGGMCYIKEREDSVNVCEYGHGYVPPGGGWISGMKSIGTLDVTYDYEVGTDP